MDDWSMNVFSWLTARRIWRVPLLVILAGVLALIPVVIALVIGLTRRW